MENILKVALITASLFVSSAFADNLILSTKLRIEYPTPLLISHGSTSLIVKYKDSSFMHVVVDPKAIYRQIDLTGLERDFIKSIFDDKARAKLPKWLSLVAKEQSDEFGVTPDNVDRFKVGKAEIYTVYNKKNNEGQIYIFDELSIHQIYTHGTKKEHDLIAHSIKER